MSAILSAELVQAIVGNDCFQRLLRLIVKAKDGVVETLSPDQNILTAKVDGGDVIWTLAPADLYSDIKEEINAALAL